MPRKYLFDGRRMYTNKDDFCSTKPLTPFSQELIEYILGEIAITVPYMGSYKYQFGKFYRNHPRLTTFYDRTVYINEYEKIYDINNIIKELRRFCPQYNIYYNNINGSIHVRVES
jgi:hypothetical protein